MNDKASQAVIDCGGLKMSEAKGSGIKKRLPICLFSR
jgi:hypothetical protein